MRKLLLLSTAVTVTAALTCALATGLKAQPVNVLTYHYGNDRVGANLDETTLTPANVNVNQFGKLFAHKVDGAVYAQPLYVANVPIPGMGTRNVVYVATEHGSIYAWDADASGGVFAYPLWHINVTTPTSVSLAGALDPAAVLNEVCITGTPVIDPSTNALYFVAQTYDTVNGVGTYNQRLHAVDIRTGVELAPFPVLIQAAVPGTDRIAGNDVCPFTPETELQRAALTLVNGVIYIGWCGITEDGRHGWILAYNALGNGTPGTQVGAFCTTPNAALGGVWGSGNGISADASGNLFAATGNGTFDGYKPGGADWSQSVLKFSLLTGLTVADSFTPFNNVALSSWDGDLGSGGTMLLPNAAGSTQHPHLMVMCGKEGRIYLLDRDNLGGFNATSDNVVQELPNAVGGTWSSPAYWTDGVNQYVYYAGGNDQGEAGDYLKAFTITNGLLSPTPYAISPTLLNFPGATPTVSSNGTQNGIVWSLETDGFQAGTPAILHAYNASNVAIELYNSTMAGSRDTASPPSKFAVPVVSNGKVYFGTNTSIQVFGLFGAAPTVVNQAAANPSTVTGISTALSALGGDTVADGGEASLTYVWSVTGTPPAPVSFSANGTNAAKSTTATFGATGTYTIECTIVGATGLTATSSVTVTVTQSAAVTNVSPSSVNLFLNASEPFSATGIDQYGMPISAGAAWKWYLEPGSVGSIDKNGVYSSETTAGSAIVLAKLNSAGGTASVTVTVSTAPPTIVDPATCTPNPVTAGTATLSIQGADPNGASTIKYKWTVVGTQPGKVTYSSDTAQDATVTFAKAGTYHLECTLTGVSGASTTSPITIVVDAPAS